MPGTSRGDIQELVDRHVREGAFAGAAVVAARAGRVTLEHYAGEAAPALPASARVLWPVASISKVFTAAALLRLVEKGTLTLNQPVGDVLTLFRSEEREEVRLRHLLTHTSGLIYESPQMEDRLRAHTSLAEMEDEAYRTTLLFQPGTGFAYADYNYLLAGRMAEVATGSSLASLLQILVLQPAGLLDTHFPPPPAEYGRIAKVRGVAAEGSPGAMYNSAYALALAHPAFGVVASATDLVRFGMLFAPNGPRIHAEATVRAMTTDQTGGVPGSHPSLTGLGERATIPWGLGFAIQNASVPALFSDLASFGTFGHGGASGCQLVVDPEADLVVGVLTNTHLRTGRERWRARLQAIVNAVFAEAG